MRMLARQALLALGPAAWLLAGLAGCGDETKNVSGDAGVAQGYDPHTAAADCQGCHPNHVEEWRSSPHAYAMVDPVFHAMVRLGQAETRGKLDQFCTRCHSPLGEHAGETEVFLDERLGVHQQRTEGLSRDAMSGVSCRACHSMTEVPQRFNGGFTLNIDGLFRGPLPDPVAPSSAHGTAFSALHASSNFCSSCHMVIGEFSTKPVRLEETFMEWVQSVFPGQKDCQNCHMPAYQGRAAVSGPIRTVHEHRFVGVDVPLVAPEAFPGYELSRQLTEQLLRESATLELAPVPAERRLEVTVQNLAGHALPSGAVVDREMWLEVTVRDSNGSVVYESGTLDEKGDLRVADSHRTTRPGTDPALVLYNQHLYFDPARETPPAPGERRSVDFLWQPNEAVNHLIPPGGRDRPSYDFSALAAGAYRVRVRLLFRSFPPHLLRKLVAEAGLDPEVPARVPTVEMASRETDMVLP